MLPGLHVAVFFFSTLLTGVDVPPPRYKRTKKKITLVGSGDEVSVDLCKLPDGVFPDPDNCDVFIRCQSRVPDVEPCPDSLLFNPFKLTCDFSKTGNCSELKDFDETTAVQTNDVVCSEDGPNVYPIQSSCTEYYMCDNDTAFKVKCPKDLLMNAEKMTCDYPENVDCDSFSSPEESTVGMKAVYEDDEDLESETENSFSSIDTSSPSAKTSVEVKSETDFDNKEKTGYTSNDLEETTSTTLNSTRNVISDKSVSTNPEITSTLGSPDDNITNNTTLKEPAQPKEKDSFPEVKPTRTDFDQDITGTTSVFTSTSNVKDIHAESISSIPDTHRERSNLEDPTEENNERDILTSDKTVTDLSSNTFRDFESSESSQQSTTENSGTLIQTSDKNIKNEGSGSDIDIIDIFTTDSNNASQQLDVSTNDISTSNSLNHTVTNEPILNTKTSSLDKTMTSDSLSESLEGVSTLDSEVEVQSTKEITELSKSEGTGTETTKSGVYLSSSYDLINQTDVVDNKARVDNITSDIESTEMIVTAFNESTTLSSVLTSLGTLESIKNESYFQLTTKTQTVVETDNKIAPEKTLTTTQALMSSDPLTDNETTKVTTSTFFETVKVTPKYIINTTTATTEEHESFDAESSGSASLSDDQNEGYEVFTESVGESKYTFAPESNIFTEKPTEKAEYIVSSHPTETSIMSEVNTEILEISDISSEDTTPNKQSSLSNEVSTSSMLNQNSTSTSSSDFINKVINTEVITSSEKISSAHIFENIETQDSSETISPVPTKIDNTTESAINEETAMSHSIDMSKASDSDLSNTTVTDTIFDKSESPMENSQERDSTMPFSTSGPPNNKKSTVSETQMNNSSRISDELSSENQYPTLTSTDLKLTDDDVITENHLTSRQNTKITEITFVETSDMFDSTSNFTEHPTTANAFSGFTESIGSDIDLRPSSLKTQFPDDTTETIDLSSESDVTIVDQTYIDMYTNKSTSNLESSSGESLSAFTADIESLTNNSTLANKNENLTLGPSEVSISSVTKKSQSTDMENSSDLISTLLNTKTEDADMSVINEQLSTSEDDFDSSKITSKYTRNNSSETEFPYEIHTSTLSEKSTNVSDSDVDTHTKESLSYVSMSSLHPPTEPSIQISETDMDFDVIISTPRVSYPEYILSSENEDTSTDVSRDDLNNKTTADFINTASNKIDDNESETIFPPKVSTSLIGDSSQTPLSKNTDSFEITSYSLDPGTITEPGATLQSSEISENLKGVSTDNYTLQINSTESTPEINETPKVSKETSINFDSTVNATVVDNAKSSTTENNLTNMYEGSSTSDAMGAFKNTSVTTVSSVTDNNNETSESFWPETKEITNENNLTSILDENTTILNLISDTVVQSTISEVTSIVNTTNMDGEISSFDISSPAVSYSKDSIASTSAIATKQNYLSTSSSLQITNSQGSTSDSSNSTDLILPITHFTDSANSIKTVNETSESPEYILNVTGTSITSTKDSYSSDKNINPENAKSTKETSDITITEFISTKLNSETPVTSETSQFTGRRFEETSPNPQTTFDIVSKNTNTEWFSKSNIDLQTIPSDSISSDKSTSDINISDVKTESTFKTTDTPSTKTATYNETPELETVSKDKFTSPANLVSSTKTLYESTSLSNLKITSETPSKTITETSHTITDILPTSTNVFIYSSAIDSSSTNPTEISESSDFSTDFKRVTIPRTVETDGSLSTHEQTELTDSITKILSTSSSASKFETEISGESSVHTTSFSKITATETEKPFPITATTRETTKKNNTIINDETTLNTNTDSISIASEIITEDRKTDNIFSTTDSPVDKTTERKTTFSKDISEISGESSVHTTSFSRIIATETENSFPITATTRDMTKENNLTNDETTLNTNTDSVSITSKTLPEDRETDDIFSTTDSSVVKTTEKKTTFLKDISESDLHTISRTEMSVYKNDTNERTTESNSDFTSVPMSSRDLEKEINSTEYSSTTYFPSDVRTETSHLSSNTDIENENKEISASDISTQYTVTESHSKGISESGLPSERTVETTVLIFNDTDKTTTESITDVSNVSITSRNIDRKTESVEDPSTTFPSSLRTETSHLSSNTGIENEKEISASDMSSQSTVTESHSKGISESDLPLEPTLETTVLIFNDTDKTTTDSITDVSNVSTTSRNIDRKTESIADPSTTYIPPALQTETSHSSVSTETESELQRISSTDIPSESKTTMNPICVTSEGNFPHPDDCNKFYRCTKGVPVQSSCVGNEHFDPIKRICTSPCLAKCDANADCGTTESKTSEVESTPTQTTSLKDVSSTSESYNTGTEETSFTSAHNYFTEDTTLDKISKSTFEQTSTAANIASRSSVLTSTTGNFWTDFSTSDESLSTIADITTTKDLTEVSSDDYMSSRSFRNITTSDDSSLVSSDVPFTSTITSEINPETQTEVTSVISSTIKSSIETSSESSKLTVSTDITPESSGDGEDSSSTRTLITSTNCENEDCLSSKLPTSATLVPFRLCPRNDFLSEPNCSEYLDCTGKVPKKLECPNGLHFNPSTRVCDWPYNAECGTSPKPLYEPTDSLKCPCKSCLIPSTKSCSHYYLCIGFTAYEMKCSNSLYFDRTKNTCNYAPLVDCGHLTSTSTATEMEPTESSTKTSTIEVSSSTKASTTPASFVCPSEEGLFRYPGNCGMFYQCANWYPHPFNCPGGTHFSETTKRCEYPCDAKCDLTLNCGISSTAPPSDPRCSCYNCRLPSPESCTKYIMCVNGKARIEYCPWGKTFDARRSTCDWAHKVTCQPSVMCPERNGLFSHKDDCHKFVHCSNGIPYVKKCPSILEFDPIKQRCEWPNGRCNYIPINTRDVDYKNVEHRKGWKCPKTFGYYPVDQHCNKFYHCSFGTPTLKECSQGLLYNPRYQTCDWKKQVRCNSNRHLKPRKCRAYDHHVVCSEDRRPKLHVLCNMYYDCTAGRACAKQCPVGLYFNNATGVCDLPENVKCLNPSEGDYSLKELSQKCAAGEHGRQVNPTNDSCFYHCRQGKVVSGCCSKGQVYNMHKNKCERRTKSLRI